MGSDTFASAYPDPRVSGRVSLAHFQPHSASSSASLPTDLLLSLLLSKSLLALALYIARDWILAQGYSVWTLNALVLVAGALGLCVWERVWEGPKGGKRREEPSSPFYPVVFAAEILVSLIALTKLSVISTLWTRGVPISLLSPSGGKKALGKSNAVFITFAVILAAYLLDSLLTSEPSVSGYGYLLGYLLLCGQRSEMLASHNGDNHSRDRIHAIGVVVAAFLASAAAWLRWILQTVPTAYSPPPAVVTTPTFDASFSLPAPTLGLLIPSAVLLALTFILFDPLLSRALLAHFPAARQVSAGWPIAVVSTIFVGYVGFGQGITVSEVGVGGLAWTAITHLISSDPRSSMVSSSSSSISTSPSKQPFTARLSVFYRHFRATIKTILATPDSKRIYFFLCLNLAYMVVQMVYGIWTNSLGLISDSIHMFFDCLALGMGLFASVMATWRPNEKFTYGYSRVETLSGFANGLFLCLISIFIVFEAIQRLIDPPEMNTSQLLVVSSVGLAVNLVGMFATGHHHHGHSHGGHDHGHDHGPPKPKPVAASHDHASHDHSGHDHSGHDHAGHDHSGHDHDEDAGDHAGHAHHGSHNMKGVFLHVMADTLGSVGVIISTLLINQYGWTGFDPLASIFIAVLIFASVVPLVVDSGRLLVLDMGEERETEVRNALLALKNVEGLSSYTCARFWPKDPSTMIGSIAVQLAPSPSSLDPSRPDHFANVEKVTQRVQRVLKNAIGGLEELTIQVEPTQGLSL
ncbi:solute carrier family 30 (zinc transporter), member 5/7, partial [Phenoliferia sp. Uapishka_3]